MVKEILRETYLNNSKKTMRKLIGKRNDISRT